MQEIDSEEYSWWLAYNRVQPFGDFRSDLRMASICSLFANANRDTKRKSTPYKVSDFMFKFDSKSSSLEKNTRARRSQLGKEFKAFCNLWQ